MTDKYFLNNKDMYLHFGFIPAPGCIDTLMQARERKEPYSNDWAEENGREFDLQAPVRFKERQFKLIGTIWADNYADYTNKLQALEDELYNGVCEVEGIVGARNLILNSDFSKSLDGINVSEGSSKSLDANNRCVIYNEIYNPRAHFENLQLKGSANYIFQFEGWFEQLDEVVWRGSNYFYVQFTKIDEYDLGFESGKRYIYMISLAGDDNGYIQLATSTELNQFRVRKPKLEVGTTATDWQPDLKANALATSIKTNKIVNSTAKPFLMPVEINLIEVLQDTGFNYLFPFNLS